jgi:hypothetical protein
LSSTSLRETESISSTCLTLCETTCGNS